MLVTTIIQVSTFTASLLLAYAFGIGFVFMFVQTPDLVDIVSACKIVSLIILLYTNREIPHNIDFAKQSDVRKINQLIIFISTLVLTLMIIKTVVQDYSILDTPEYGRIMLSFFNDNSYWISTIPIFSYVLLDLFIAFGRGSSPQDRKIAVEFILFRDLVCALPLALVLLLAELYLFFAPHEAADAHAQFFFSGAIAVILLASSISSRALDLMQTRRRRAGESALTEPLIA
jgi:hypothetical protein